MSNTDSRVDESEQEVTVRQLTAGEWVEVLRDTNYALKVSDGTREGTMFFWMDDGWLQARRLTWVAHKQVGNSDLTAELENDEMRSELVVRDD